MGDRRCDACKGSVPSRMSRQRNDKGQLVCEECITMKTPEWTAGLQYAASVGERSEIRRRLAEALASIAKVRRAHTSGLSVIAHDSGDNAIINHCPFCGSGAVIGGSDGTVTCDFCHSNFTVQVQPAHPFMPQTVDGQPTPPAGMPGDAPTEMSAPLDPAVNETEEGVVDDSAQAAGATPFNAPKDAPAAPEKADKPKGGSQPPWLKNKASSRRTAAKFCPEHTYLVEPGTQANIVSSDDCDVCGHEFDDSTVDYPVAGNNLSADFGTPRLSSTYANAEGNRLDQHAYMARLALEFADDRAEVLDSVRTANLQRHAESTITCPTCKGEGDVEWGIECEDCGGTGLVSLGKQADLLNPDTGIDDNGRDQLGHTDPYFDGDQLAANAHPLPDQFLRPPREWMEMTQWGRGS